jgi:hypothetical protein
MIVPVDPAATPAEVSLEDPSDDDETAIRSHVEWDLVG